MYVTQSLQSHQTYLSHLLVLVKDLSTILRLLLEWKGSRGLSRGRLHYRMGTLLVAYVRTVRQKVACT